LVVSVSTTGKPHPDGQVVQVRSLRAEHTIGVQHFAGELQASFKAEEFRPESPVVRTAATSSIHVVLH
jgi:hypothetical protein